MRTSVDINEALAERVRGLMQRKRVTLRALIEDGLRHVVEQDAQGRGTFRLRDASVGGDGMAKGVPDLSWDTLRRFLYPG